MSLPRVHAFKALPLPRPPILRRGFVNAPAPTSCGAAVIGAPEINPTTQVHFAKAAFSRSSRVSASINRLHRRIHLHFLYDFRFLYRLPERQQHRRSSARESKAIRFSCASFVPTRRETKIRSGAQAFNTTTSHLHLNHHQTRSIVHSFIHQHRCASTLR